MKKKDILLVLALLLFGAYAGARTNHNREQTREIEVLTRIELHNQMMATTLESGQNGVNDAQ